MLVLLGNTHASIELVAHDKSGTNITEHGMVSTSLANSKFWFSSKTDFNFIRKSGLKLVKIPVLFVKVYNF